MRTSATLISESASRESNLTTPCCDGNREVSTEATDGFVHELCAYACEEQAVIVHQYDAALHRGILSSTSVPPPGVLVTIAAPPARSRRPQMESRTP